MHKDDANMSRWSAYKGRYLNRRNRLNVKRDLKKGVYRNDTIEKDDDGVMTQSAEVPHSK